MRKSPTQMERQIEACLRRDGPRCFNALGRLADAPNAQILARTLRRMMRDGIVARRIIDAGPPRSEYRLIELDAAGEIESC
jgi:DNA-binding HxlR family transcriptional regulator